MMTCLIGVFVSRSWLSCAETGGTAQCRASSHMTAIAAHPFFASLDTFISMNRSCMFCALPDLRLPDLLVRAEGGGTNPPGIVRSLDVAFSSQLVCRGMLCCSLAGFVRMEK